MDIVMLRTGILAIPESIIEAAEIDGGGHRRQPAADRRLSLFAKVFRKGYDHRRRQGIKRVEMYGERLPFGGGRGIIAAWAKM